MYLVLTCVAMVIGCVWYPCVWLWQLGMVGCLRVWRWQLNVVGAHLYVGGSWNSWVARL